MAEVATTSIFFAKDCRASSSAPLAQFRSAPTLKQWFVVPLSPSWMEASFGLKSVLRSRTTSAIRGGRLMNMWTWGTSFPKIGKLASCIGSSELRQSMSFFTSVPSLRVASRCLTSRLKQAVICSKCCLMTSGGLTRRRLPDFLREFGTVKAIVSLIGHGCSLEFVFSQKLLHENDLFVVAVLECDKSILLIRTNWWATVRLRRDVARTTSTKSELGISSQFL